ncbi:hypothetical protein Tco_0442510 [Tanacetum coccineum]
MDDNTYQIDDDVDARLKEPTQTDKEVVQGEGADAEMNDAQQGNENLETTQEQVVDDAHVIISTIIKKSEVPVTSSSRLSDLASKFLNFSDIPHADAENFSLLDVHVHHEVPRTQAPTLLTVPVFVITKSSPDFDELMSTPIDFSSYILNGLKIKNLTQEILLGPAFRLVKGTRSNYAKLEYDFEECYKALSKNLDWENPEGGDYPFDLSKPLPLITCGKRQRVPVEYFINNDLKYLQGGVSTMTYMTSTTKTKAA